MYVGAFALGWFAHWVYHEVAILLDNGFTIYINKEN
jgi:hypothetical protein